MPQKAEKFEEAAEIRAQLFGLRELQKKIVFLIKNSLIFRPTKRLAIYKTCLIYPSHLVVLRVMIFHQSGTNVVGSMVVFTNGASDRSEYRKFKLRQQKNDDTANLHEVIERRLKHSEWMFPNLVILDGGLNQVNAVKDLLWAHNIAVIGRDKIRRSHTKCCRAYYYSGACKTNNSDETYRTVLLRPDSHVAKLIARIDDEAHRFAITYHTLLKRKNMLR